MPRIFVTDLAIEDAIVDNCELSTIPKGESLKDLTFHLTYEDLYNIINTAIDYSTDWSWEGFDTY